MSPRSSKSEQAKGQVRGLLDEVLERRVLLYMLAAGATLAGASSAQAEVVFTPSTATCVSFDHGTVQIDLNHDGQKDFTLTCADWQFGSNASGSYLDVKGVVGSNLTLESTGGFAAALKKGAPITSGAKFGNNVVLGANACSRYSCQGEGNFNGASNRILGVRFLINGEVHYGWIGFRYAWAGGATLGGWAYETVPNMRIRAGAKQGAESGMDSAAVHAAEPTSLELLAAGHAAIADRRRRISA